MATPVLTSQIHKTCVVRVRNFLKTICNNFWRNKMKYLILLSLLFSTASYSSCRNPAIKHKFDIQQGYPHGRKGYIVDHICALEVGGIDATINMQYQTIAEAKVKDKVEGTAFGKAKYCTTSNSTISRQVFNCN